MTTPVDRLKDLLFEREARRLSDVQRQVDALASADAKRAEDLTRRQQDMETRLDQVFERSGTDDRLRKSVSIVIDGALRDAEVSKHEQLARAIAPLVVKTIRTELKNAQPELVQAVYPMTGQIVKQYVQAAMADLIAEINRKLGGGQQSELEARARALGIPVADLLLAETQHLQVDELFLIKRGSGDLIAHWERPTEAGVTTAPQGSNRDVLIAGYLSGITAFSEEAFNETKGSLRSLDMDGQRVFVRASPAFLLAARCSGSAPQSVERIIDDAFMHVLGDVQASGRGDLDFKGILPAVAASLSERFDAERKRLEGEAAAVAKPPSFARLYLMIAAILLPLLGWFGWQTWRQWQVQRVLGEAHSVLAGEALLRGFPLQMTVSDSGRQLIVSGLTPSAEARGRLIDSLKRALPGTSIDDATGVLPAAPVVAGRDSRERIEELARDYAIFFGNGTDLSDERSANTTVERLAGLMRGNDAVVRVVGYTDDIGDAATNQQLAQARADRVAAMLAGAGVARERLVVIGRGVGRDISRSRGASSANRRVAFELGYFGEPAQ